MINKTNLITAAMALGAAIGAADSQPRYYNNGYYTLQPPTPGYGYPLPFRSTLMPRRSMGFMRMPIPPSQRSNLLRPLSVCMSTRPL